MVHLIVPQKAALPSVAQLTSFLRNSGWTRSHSGERWATYSRADDGTEIEVPLRGGAPDFPRAVRLLIDDLSQVLEVDQASLLRDILLQDKDLLRLRIESSGTASGKLNLEAGRGVYQGVRDAVLAIVSSVLEPKPIFPPRKPDEAMNLLRRTRLGNTEHGSLVLVIENPLPPRLGQQPLDGITFDDLPIERKVSLRYAEATSALRYAVERSQLDDDISPFTDAVPKGVSANLCEAVAQIMEATEAERLTFSASCGANWPLIRPPRSGVLAHSSLPFLQAAAKGMREAALYAETTVEGPIVKLHSDDVAGGGKIGVRADALGGVKTIWVTLDALSYSRVTTAHRDMKLVRLTGELKRQGRWRLLNPRDIQVVELDEDDG